MAYLARVGRAIDQPVYLPHNGQELLPEQVAMSRFPAPVNNSAYARISGDLNPIHVNPYFADMAGLPDTITHGGWTSAATRRLIDVFAAENQPQRVAFYHAAFTSMVLPGDQLQAKVCRAHRRRERSGSLIVRL